MEECEQFVDGRHGSDISLVELVTLLKDRLTLIVHKLSDESLVYTEFVVLNSGGLDVSWLSRLKSMLTAIVFESSANRSETIDKVHHLWTQIYDCVGLRLGLSTESLRLAATLPNPVCPSRPLGEEDAALMLHRQSTGGPEQVIEITRWLEGVAAVNRLAVNLRRDEVTRIAQARMVATAVYLREDFTSRQRAKIQRRCQKVIFRIYGVYRKYVRWAVGDFVRLARCIEVSSKSV